MRVQQGGSISGGASSAPSELLSEASLICSCTTGVGCEVLGMGSPNFNTPCSGPPLSGWGGADRATWRWVEGSTFDTIRGLANLNAALAILGMESGSKKMGSMRCLCVSRKAFSKRRSKLGGSPIASGASASLCSIRETASHTAVDHAWPVPHGKMWVDYPPPRQQCRGSPPIRLRGQERNCSQGACPLPGQP